MTIGPAGTRTCDRCGKTVPMEAVPTRTKVVYMGLCHCDHLHCEICDSRDDRSCLSRGARNCPKCSAPIQFKADL